MYFIWWWNVKCLILLLKKMILEDAKVSSFSLDFQTHSKIILIPCTNWVRSLFRRLQIEFFPLVYGSYNSHVAINQQENQGSGFFCCAWGRGAIYSNMTDKIGIWKCWFLRRGETREPSKKPLGVRERTNNKLNPHMASMLGFEPGPHWWEESALTSAPPFFSVISQYILLFCYSFKLDFFVAHLPQHVW